MAGIVHALEMQPGVIIGGCVTTVQDYGCVISVINATDKLVDIQTPHVELIPLEAKTEIQVFNIEISKAPDKPMSRIEKVKSALRVEHLNKEKRKAIVRIYENYSDIFHIEEEPLTRISSETRDCDRPGGGAR